MLALCSFYCTRIEESSPSFNQAVFQFLEFQIIPAKDSVEECIWQEPLLSEDKIIENWKRLLSFNLLFDLAQAYQSDMAVKVRLFEHHPWNQSSQYFRSLIALNHALAKMPIPEVGAHLLESGAALIDLHEYYPWLALPFTPQHFEFGIFLCMLALLTKRQDLQETVLRLAHWQLNTLDGNAQPLSGLFVREKDGRNLQHLCLSYLFFRGASILSEETPFGAIADAVIKKIQEDKDQKQNEMDPLWPLIEKWFEKYKTISNAPLNLSEHIYDPSTALVGYRSSFQHVICTLHGGHTGLGTLRQGDIEISSYGPQYLPLGDCQGFGIEGNALSDQGMRRSTIEWRRHSFCLKGCTRLVDQPSSSSLETRKFRGIWLEVSQEFKRPHFYLKTTFLGLDGWEGIAFSFFIKTARCKIDSQYLHPLTLERYEGSGQTLTLEGQQTVLEMQAPFFKGKMQVIPLAGGDNFWGADFLVAYFLSSDQRHYQWHIGPKEGLKS